MKILVMMVALVASYSVLSCDIDGKSSGIVENNDLYIGVDQITDAGITEEAFNRVIDEVSAIYAPIIEAKGKKLEVQRKWTDGTVNAYAQQIGNTWRISMFGGLARHETITEDGFALVVCHELGHHLGGAPKKKAGWGGSVRWASNEGQADYWGNAKCMKRYMESHDNIAIVEKMVIPETAQKACAASYADKKEYAICLRGAMAGHSLGELFRVLRRLRSPVKFSTPDAGTVTRTNDRHPAPQCRLDTYFQGSLCTIAGDSEVSDTDAEVGSCTRKQEHNQGLRPLCWYKP